MGWRRPMPVFLAAALLVDLRYIVSVSDVVDTDKYYLGAWWIPWSYLKAAFSPYTPDYMGILKFNYHPSSILANVLYLIVDLAGINATVVLPFLLHLSLMVGMYILLSRLTSREWLRILGSLAYAFNPVSSGYYIAIPIAFLPAFIPVMTAFILDLGRRHAPAAIARAGLVAGFTVSMHYSFAPLAAMIAAIAGAYTLLYSPSRAKTLRALLLTSAVGLIAMLPTLAHLYVIHAIAPDRQLNYLSQGLSPESVARDILYCYRISPEGLLSLTWDPCHKQTRIIYWGNPLSMLHIPLVIATLLLAALVPRLRDPPKAIAASLSSTLMALSLFLILLLSSAGPLLSDNLLVTAIRIPIKVRVVAEFSLIVGTVVAIDYLHGSRPLRPWKRLGATTVLVLVLAVFLAGTTVPYIVKTISLETYSQASSLIEPLYSEGVITPEPRGIIIPYTHEALLNSPPNMRLLPLFPRPPIVGYLDNARDAGTLPLALEALGVGRVIVTPLRDTGFYDVALSKGANTSKIADMLSKSPYYTLRYNASGVYAYDAPWSILDSYSGVYVPSKPQLARLTSYILGSGGYLPTVYPLDPVKQGLRPVEAYMLSTIYLGSSAGDYELASGGGRLFVYFTGVSGWSSPRLPTYYTVTLGPGERAEVARGSMMTLTISHAPEGSRLQVLGEGGRVLLDINVGAGGAAECRSPDGIASYGGVYSVSLGYSGREVVAKLGDATCRVEASGVLRILYESGVRESSVTVAGTTYGPIYRAEVVDGWRVLVYRMGYNSLYRLQGVETLNLEPLVADGYGNAWLYRGGDPVVTEPLGRVYKLLGVLVWLIYYPVLLLAASGLGVKRLYRGGSSGDS